MNSFLSAAVSQIKLPSQAYQLVNMHFNLNILHDTQTSRIIISYTLKSIANGFLYVAYWTKSFQMSKLQANETFQISLWIPHQPYPNVRTVNSPS